MIGARSSSVRECLVLSLYQCAQEVLSSTRPVMEAMMRSRCPGLVMATLGLIVVSTLAGQAASEESRCQRGDLVRRIELRVADDADRLPCQVVYWKDQESPGEPRVPWRANSDLGFCIAKAREMIDGLQSAGWTCDAAALTAQDPAALAAIEPAEGFAREAPAPAAAPSPPDDAASRISEEAARATAPSPPDDAANQVALAEGTSRGPAAQATAPSPPDDAASRVALAEGTSREPATQLTAPPPPDDAANGVATSDQATLQTALDRDIRRLEELAGASSGRFKPEMTTLGDLDGDGVPDGAVLLSHRDDDGGASHHLLAYVFDGNTFRPIARLNLESYYQNVASVALGGIADGGIELLLHTRRAGDPPCCPSGRRNATFELRDGQFVLVAESDSGA
jgi:hypothetical protein